MPVTLRDLRLTSSWELKVKTGSLLGARENAGDQVLGLYLISWDDGASFLDQSRSEVKQNKAIQDNFSNSIENCSKE